MLYHALDPLPLCECAPTVLSWAYCLVVQSQANFVIPVVSFTQFNAKAPTLTNMVIISNPKDSSRIARMHVTKMPDQSVFLGNGVLSTTDNDHWQEQREHFIEAFLPYSKPQIITPPFWWLPTNLDLRCVFHPAPLKVGAG